MKCLALLGLALASVGGAGAEVRSTSVSSHGERYRIEVTSFIAAPPARVMGLLTDYARLQRLHPMVRSSEVLADGEGGSRVRTTYHDCPLFIFCVEFAHTSRFTRRSERHLVAEADPAASDFSYGRFQWLALPEGEGTRLLFDAEVEPDFWVPPVLGDWVLKRRLLEVAVDLQQAIQVLALGGSLPPGWPDAAPDPEPLQY